MHKLRPLRLLLGVALVCTALGLSASTKADDWDRKTVVTFSAPVEVPGSALPAGTYVFKLAPSLDDRHVVEILNEDETELITTVRAVPTRRAQTPGESDFTFDEGYADSPKPLHAWFYPGSDIGNEFVYAENQRSQNGNYHQNQQ